MTVTAPNQTDTLVEYLERFQTDDERAAATLQFRAKSIGVKVLNEETGLIGGWGIPFGGPVKDKNHAAGKDLDGEYFDETTNFCFDWFPNEGRPVLYDHGTDPEVKLTTVGRQTSKFVDPKLGVWVETQLDMANQYAKYILELAKKGVLGYSSGALGGYVKREANGKISQWPYIEQTVTVRPANPYALIAQDAVKHLNDVGALPPELSELAPVAPEPVEIVIPSLADALISEVKAAKLQKALVIPDGMSMTEFRTALEDAIEDSLPGDNNEAYVTDVRDNKAVASVGDSWDEYWQFEFTVTDGKISIVGAGVQVEQVSNWTPTEGKGAALEQLATHLESNGWQRSGQKFNARHMGQLHQSMKVQSDLHAATCDMGKDCPAYVAPVEAKTTTETPPGIPELETAERKAQRQEIDALLAGVKLGGR